MGISNLLMFLSSGYTLANYILQIRYTKRKKSVYGLSSDFITLAWVSYVTSLISSSYYLLNSRVIEEHLERFPFHPDIFVSNLLFVSDTMGAVIVSGILIQSFAVYKRTMHRYQGLSAVCISFISLQLVVFLWILHNVRKGRMKLFLLDAIDFIWFVSKLSSAVKLIPQLIINWSDESVSGINDSFLRYEWISAALLAIAKLTMDNDKWFRIPVNYDSWVNLVVRILLLSILKFQKDYLYCKPQPSLILGYLKT